MPTLPVLDETGSVLRREALEAGLSADDIRALVSDGQWVRIRRGAYAARDCWDDMAPPDRHLTMAQAVVRTLERPVVLGHVTAAVALGLPTWGADLSQVHVIRPDRRHGSRSEAGVVHHSAELPDDHVTDIGGLPVTTAARTLVDHARTSRFESAVVTLDAGLNRRLTTDDAVLEMLTWQRDWPGSRAASRAVSFADGASESPGESRSRVRMDEAGLPRPELQAEIVDFDGRFVARSDFLFIEQRTIGEFDGRIKYRVGTAGTNLEEVLWREKLREDALRSLGYEVVRITWADLERSPRWFRQMFLQAFARAQGRSRPPVLR